MPIRNYTNVAQPTSLTSGVGQDDTTLPVVSTTGYPSAPFTIAIDRGGANEEAVLVQGKTANSFTDCIRGYNGTTKQSHLSTVSVEHVAIALDYADANDHIYNTTRDDHTQYYNAARLAAAMSAGTVSSPVGTVPVGGIIPYFGTASPDTDRWLLCNGQAVSRSTYSTLFGVIGTSAGSGDNLSTFNVPNLRGRTIVGLDNMGGASANVIVNAAADQLGGSWGAEAVTLTISEIPNHAHTINHTHSGSTGNDNNAHLHAGAGGEQIAVFSAGSSLWVKGLGPGGGQPGDQPVSFTTYTGAPSNLHTHAINISHNGNSGNAGGGGAHANVQPSMAMAFLIRAA